MNQSFVRVGGLFFMFMISCNELAGIRPAQYDPCLDFGYGGKGGAEADLDDVCTTTVTVTSTTAGGGGGGGGMMQQDGGPDASKPGEKGDACTSWKECISGICNNAVCE